MIPRRLQEMLRSRLAEYPAVALLGPRQVGKTTLALEIAETLDATYLDLESQVDRVKLAEPELYLADHEDRLVILDEVHRLPDLFQSLRGLIDRGRRKGRRAGRFLLLGSASMDLLKQSGETVWSAFLLGDRSEGVSALKAFALQSRSRPPRNPHRFPDDQGPPRRMAMLRPQQRAARRYGLQPDRRDVPNPSGNSEARQPLQPGAAKESSLPRHAETRLTR